MTYESAYLDRVFVEFYNGSTWQDISDYVVSEINGFGGFESYEPTDRVAYLGMVDFQVNNVSGTFSPMGADSIRGLNTFTGWDRGTKIRIRGSFAEEEDSIWTGFVSDVLTDPGNKGSQRATVICVDWLDVPTRYPMRGSEIEVDFRIDEAFESILSRLDVQPEGTDLDTGDNVFEAVFDSVRGRTKSVGEMNKLALSELGYVYVLKNGYLRVENSSARRGTRPLDTAHVPQPYAPPLLWDGTGTMNGNIALQENGQMILVDEQRVPSLATTMETMEIGTAKNFINTVYVRAFPTRVATSLEVVYQLSSPIKIGGGATIRFQGNYTNPDGGRAINATNQQDLVATTDYEMWSGVSGSFGIGTDRTASLSVDATFYGDVVEFELTSTAANASYITKLQVRGYGIYRDTTTYENYTDEDFVEEYGDASVDIEQRYQSDTYQGIVYAKSVVERFKDPRSRVFSASFSANLTADHMLAFMKLDVGSKIPATEIRSGITRHYFIIKRSFKIKHGGLISYNFRLVEAESLADQSLVRTSFNFGSRAYDYVANFGYLPRVAGLTKRSIYVHINPKVIGGRLIRTIRNDNDEGFSVAFGGTNQLQFYQKDTDTVGVWLTATGTFTAGQAYDILFMRDRSLNPRAAPTLYVNGSPMSLIEDSTPDSDTIADEKGLTLRIGNVNVSGTMPCVRIYDDVLSEHDARLLTYNRISGTNNYLTDNLVFEAPCLPYDRQNDIPQVGTKLIDNVHYSVGELTEKTARAWIARTTPNGMNNTFVIDYSPSLGIFSAVGANACMTSPDGMNWSTGTLAGSIFGIHWSEEQQIFVGVGPNTVKTSTNGSSWTNRTPAASNDWRGIAYSPEMNLWVATSIDGTVGQRVMTSPNGIDWTIRSGKGGIHAIWVADWGLFISCDYNASTTGISTSPDGINWTARTVPVSVSLYGIAYSPTLGRAVVTGDNTVLYSNNGIEWTRTEVIQLENWKKVAWSSELGLFMTVSDSGALRSMYSSDGITWTGLGAAHSSYGWYGIVWSEELRIFVAVQYNVALNSAMTY